jgi:hypothetical protein
MFLQGSMRGGGGLARGSSQVDDGVLEEDEEDEADLKGAFEVKKRAFLSHLYIKMMFLPRQARGKHRETSKKPVLSKACDWDGSGTIDAEELHGKPKNAF